MAQYTRAMKQKITYVFPLLDTFIRLRLADFQCPLSAILVPGCACNLGVEAHILFETEAFAYLFEIVHHVLGGREEGWPIGLGNVSEALRMGVEERILHSE
jgi:hypothetical protein